MVTKNTIDLIQTNLNNLSRDIQTMRDSGEANSNTEDYQAAQNNYAEQEKLLEEAKKTLKTKS